MLVASLLVVLLASCGPAYVSTGVGYGGYYGRPYYGYGGGYGYGYGYNPYGYYRPPVIVAPRVVVPRYRNYGPGYVPRAYGGGSPGARGGYGGGFGGGGGRSRGPR